MPSQQLFCAIQFYQQNYTQLYQFYTLGSKMPEKSAKAARKFMMKLFRWGSISPTFYEQLLNAQIPKAQKKTDSLIVFLCFQDLSS